MRKENGAGYIFLLPWIIGLLMFTIIPIFASLYLSFTDYNMLNPPKFTAIENYVRLFTDKKFSTSLLVTFKYVFISVPLLLAFALFLAVLLNKGIRGLRVYRAVYYIPSLIGQSVAIAILWRQVFNKEGLVNTFLSVFGIEGHNWISTPEYALYTIILLSVWQFGAPMLIFLSALKQVPVELYEAASIDGASKPRMFFSITFPMITPIIFFNLIMQIIRAFQAFNSVYVISNGLGGPLDSTLVFTLYLYQRGFAYYEMGYASTMAWVLLIIISIIIGILFLTSKKWVYYTDE